jgi:TolB protein
MNLWKAPIAALAAAGMLIAGATASLASGQHRTAAAVPAGVPWHQVGPGWVLAQYSKSRPGGGHSGPETLDLISPSGTSYQLASWPDNLTAPSLLSWSPDGTRALLQVPAGNNIVYEQMTLATGAVSRLAMPGQWTPIGYVPPGGGAIMASLTRNNEQALALFSPAGHLIRKLGITTLSGYVLPAASGAEFVAPSEHGVELITGTGSLIRQLPVPGSTANSCNALRWWTASTVLVSCLPPHASGFQLWLVPAGGQRPAALTPLRPARSQDLGDINAWQLDGGLYVQGAGPCGVVYIFRQAASGSIKLVNVPHTVGNDAQVLTAHGSSLLVQAPTSCEGSNSLFWFDPATGAEQWLVHAPGNQVGVTEAIPFFSRENA